MADFHTQILPDHNNGGGNSSPNSDTPPPPQSNWKKYLLVFLLVFGGIIVIGVVAFPDATAVITRKITTIGESPEKKRQREEEERKKAEEERKQKELEDRKKRAEQSQTDNNTGEDTGDDDEKLRIEEEKRRQKEDADNKRKTDVAKKKEEERKKQEELEREKNALDPASIAISGDETERLKPGTSLTINSTYDPSKRYKNNFNPGVLTWFMGNTNIGNGPSVTYPFNDPGAYTINLIKDGVIIGRKTVIVSSSRSEVMKLIDALGAAARANKGSEIVAAKKRLATHFGNRPTLIFPNMEKGTLDELLDEMVVSYAADNSYTAKISDVKISTENGKISSMSIR
jgi:flagellar biosynthesis GTPase FlhF